MRLSRIHDEQAQGVIEFALIGTILLTVFLGTVDYARFLYDGVAIRSAARVGAEMASNHCIGVFNGSYASCEKTFSITNNYIFQATECEAKQYLNVPPSSQFRPIPTSCIPSNPNATGWTDPCPSSSCSACPSSGQEVCIVRTDSSGNIQTTPTTGQTVTVFIGYHFQTISFLMSPFFNDQSCWSTSGSPAASSTDDTTQNHHNICAEAAGRVS